MTDPSNGRIEAPWTDEQVEALNRFQKAGRFHPFTCGSDNRCDAVHSAYKNSSGDHDYGLLIATRDGWICPACSYRQNWAHAFMLSRLAQGLDSPL